MSNQNRVNAAALTSIDSAGFTGSYQVINSSGLPYPCFLVRLINDSDRDVTISYDGATDNDYLRSGETLQFPAQSNAGPSSWESIFSKGTKVYVKGSAGTGLVYLAAYYTPKV